MTTCGERKGGPPGAWLAAVALAWLAGGCGHGAAGEPSADGSVGDGFAADAPGGPDATTGSEGAVAPPEAGAADATQPDAPADAGAPSGDAPDDGGPGDATIVFFPDASCLVEIDEPPLLPGTHVPIGTDIQWDSNPPSSGPHYPIWAAYQAYGSPVPRGYYVHDLEHGAVVLLYDCGDAGCPDVVAGLQAASDAIPDDPLCIADDAGVRVRTVITPDPLIGVPVAAAAWGWVYKAQCLDLPTLRDFALAHYAQGPEALCSNGTTQF